MALTPDDDRISAYLDGELTPEQRIAFEVELADAPVVQRLVEELGGLKQRVHELPSVGVRINLAPEILARLPQVNLTKRASSKRQRESGFAMGRRTAAGLLGTLAIMTLAVGTTLWWQTPRQRFQSEMLVLESRSEQEPFDLAMRDAGSARFTAEPPGSRMSSQLLPESEAPKAPLTKSMMASGATGVRPGEPADAFLGTAVELNRTRKWAQTLAAPQGAIVESNLPGQQVLTSLYLQNTKPPNTNLPNSSPTSEMIPIELYCVSVPQTAQMLATSLGNHGIVMMNDLRSVADSQTSVAVDGTMHNFKMSVTSEPIGRPGGAAAPSSAPDEFGAAASSTPPSVTRKAAAESASDSTKLMAGTDLDADGFRREGEVAMYVDAPASQMLQFLVETEQQSAVSKLMINHLEPVYFFDSSAQQNASQVKEDRERTQDPEPVTQAESMAKRDAKDKADDPSDRRGNPLPLERDNATASQGQAAWLELDFASSQTQNVPPSAVYGLTAGSARRGYQLQTPLRDSSLRSEDSSSLSQISEPAQTELSSAAPSSRMSYLPQVEESQTQTSRLEMEPRWRVLLILRPQTEPPADVPPAPALPEE